jgi:hypothetical protein
LKESALKGTDWQGHPAKTAVSDVLQPLWRGALSKEMAHGALVLQSLQCEALGMETASGTLVGELRLVPLLEEPPKTFPAVGVEKPIDWGGQMLMATVLKSETLLEIQESDLEELETSSVI